MTELIPGKRYRVTVEGTLDGDGELRIENRDDVDYLGAVALRIATVELLPDPLPTTPGSVIRDNINGILFFCYRVNRWRDETGHSFGTEQLEAETFTVLFDAGAPRA